MRTGPVIWLGVLFLFLAALYIYLSSAVPRGVSAYLSRQIEKSTGGKVVVSLQVHPFWKLLSGRFDSLEITGTHLVIGSVPLSKAHLLWYDGQVDPGQLEVGVLSVKFLGSLTVSGTVLSSTVPTFFPASLNQFNPTVSIAPTGIVLRGKAQVAGYTIPVTVTGDLVPSSDGQSLFFQTARLTADGQSLPILPDTSVFSLKGVSMPKGMGLVFTGVSLGRGTVTVKARAVNP